MRLLKNGAIVDDGGTIVVRLVYAKPKLQRFVLACLCRQAEIEALLRGAGDATDDMQQDGEDRELLGR